MKKADMIIVVFVILLAAVLYGVNEWTKSQYGGNKEVVIKVENEVYARHKLDDVIDETYVIETDLGRNVVYIKDGEVWIHEANCPDDTCVRDGRISEPGEILVCLPHRVVVEVVGQRNSEVDVISH